MALLYISLPDRAAVWQPIFDAAGVPMIIGEEAVTDPAEVIYIACWQPPADLSIYPNLKAVICVAAGVDHMPPMPEGVVLTRTIASSIAPMVRDWVVMATLMLHRQMPAYIEQAKTGIWKSQGIQSSQSRRVGIMGMGRIGALTAQTLSSLGFDVAGWSRSGTPVDGIEVYGAVDLPAFLQRTDLLVCLLPLTKETRGILGQDVFNQLPQGAMLAHAGRGSQLDMKALKLALDSGQIHSVMMDVTNPEPLPADHWAWTDPRVIITPHVGSVTDYAEGAEHALNVIRALRSGEDIPGLVDQSRGY
ncbi:glyoxylate/hydroxypyruvate reductase A [Donghicola sp.]|jgi:glyoxylate/hydroxypyruvate reductase A|uniref:2-hydroxyacid dehydrogenase n=1 Tax=Donghicola sp. TaxID=1929294 RepID=UPI0025EC9C7C|nr:glyoxylate/hydroxypyruvate reductase A [Donghicola sp.]MCT4579670.1 glyoxylate/hydroxypyruvate reductase A [Donghicola sp.]